jgi:hypothetical protein
MIMTQETLMRLYSFVNALYMREVQWGIQTAHCLEDMHQKYTEIPEKQAIITDWARNHKTMILLDGGNNRALGDIMHSFTKNIKTYPWAFFSEDIASLNNAMTCVTIILPENIYNLKEDIDLVGMVPRNYFYFEDGDGGRTRQYLNIEEEFIFKLIKSRQLAR